MDQIFLTAIEVVGTIAFAISGIRLAAARNFDWFGAYIIGLVTAIGGGTLRDVLLDIPVFWMQTPLYLLVTGISLAITIVFRRTLVGFNRSLYIFDAIGLALFVVIGIQKSLMTGYPFWVAIVMGVITGSFGGVIRDILINIEPLFFRKDIYATACIAGGLVYWIIYLLGGSDLLQQSACAVTVIGLRLCAIHYNWALPVLNYEYKKPDKLDK
ncbi:MAG: trimeric intracellular cation channel family protein [Barnesiella sp.]|nr:trimeric intracellular cation channel family protein [Bacteroidales bacterium]MBD5246077.1 trimeric intracellular cation channel family protein [Barnesiella sp.]MBD5249413.1 trimeric intracellular cation channel family protein [Barnesiella sp.]